MTRPKSLFRFDDSVELASSAVVAELPADIGSKAALLDELAQRLRFPDYFGTNWDALEECIRDLSWLPAGPVVLRHTDMPLADDAANLRTYLSILGDAVEKWLGSRDREFIVFFPRETQEMVVLHYPHNPEFLTRIFLIIVH